MTRPRPAAALTVLILAGLLAVAMLRRAPRPATGPKDTIYAMLDAARSGSTSAYLAQYTGPLAGQLRQAVSSAYLKSSNAEIKGVAISEPQFLSEREATVRVEYIYQDRNEAQTLWLEQEGGAWRIARVDSAERVKTLVPYGTPVE
jgi:hypothetical protein